MVGATERMQIIEKLYMDHQANGFVTEDEALSLFVAHKIPLNEIDSITEHLLSMGVIIKAEDNPDDDFVDRSKLDYNEIFEEVVSIEPGLTNFIDYVRTITPPQNREWQNLMPQAKNGNPYAHNRLIEMYLRIAIKQALYSSQKYILPLEDTIQDGIVGLMVAIKKFDPTEHEKFSTYAPWWIGQSISRRRRLSNNPMYFPVHVLENLFPIQSIVLEHACEHCPNDARLICPNLLMKITSKYEWTPVEATDYIHYFKQWSYIEDYFEDNEEISDKGEFADYLAEYADLAYSRKVILNHINDLRERESLVIKLRYGFTDRGSLTLEDIGQILGVTRERVRQIEKKALRKICSKLSFENKAKQKD